MTDPHIGLEQTAQTYPQSLNDYIARVIPMALRVCFGLYFVLILSHSLLLKGQVRWVMLLTSSLSVVWYLLLWLWWRNNAPRLVPLVAFLAWFPIWLNTFLHLWVSGEIHQTTNLFFTLIVGALFLVWQSWFWSASGLLMVSWVVLAWRLQSDPLLVHYSFSLLFFWTLSWIIHLAQRAMLRESWRLRESSNARREQLEVTMHELQTQQAQNEASIAELRSYSVRMRQILEHAPVLVCLLDLNGRIQMIEGKDAEAFRQQTEQAREEELLTQKLMPLTPLLHKARRQEDAKGIVHMLDRIWSAHLRLVLSETQEPLFVVAVLIDTTERYENEQAREQFVSMVSHELRTPLTAIHGAIQLISSGAAAAPPLHDKMIALMQRNTSRLQQIINDLLDLNKMNVTQLHFVNENKALQPLLLLTMEMLSSHAEQCQIELRLQAPTTPIYVKVDEQRLQQVVNNLLSNALKFSPANTEIVIEVEQKHSQVYVYVCDEGPGVPVAMQEKIFEPFVQVDASSQRAKGGTGLGLNLAKRFLQRMEGAIGYEAGRAGACFWFRLPIVNA